MTLLRPPFLGCRNQLNLDGSVFYTPLGRPDLGGSTFYDLAGHNLCTVTGTTVGYQGRTMDGDDHIDLTLPFTSITAQQSGTLAFWFKPTTLDDAVSHTLFGYGGDEAALANMAVRLLLAGGSYYLSFMGWTAALDHVRGGTALVAGTWYCGLVSSSGTAWTIDLFTASGGGGAETITIVAGANTGTWMADITPTNPALPLGILRNGGAYIQGFKGVLGDVLSFSSPLSAGGKLRLVQSTKWRYN